jgi:hypothetical protein
MNNAEAPLTLPKKKASDQDFNQAELHAWAQSVEDAIAKRLDGLRPRTPLVENAVFLYLFSRLIRQRIPLVERGKPFSDELLKDLLLQTPIHARVVAEGMAWLFLAQPKEISAWKPRMSNVTKINILWNLFYFSFMFSIVGRKASINIPDLRKIWFWFWQDGHFLHFFIAGIFLWIALIGLKTLGKKSASINMPSGSLLLACQNARLAAAKQIGFQDHLQESFRASLGCFSLAIFVFGGLVATVCGGWLSYILAEAIFGEKAWQTTFWTIFFTFQSCIWTIGALLWLAGGRPSLEKQKEAIQSLAFLVNAWRDRAREDADDSFASVVAPPPVSVSSRTRSGAELPRVAALELLPKLFADQNRPKRS